MEVDVIKAANIFAATIDRSFSWYINDIAKKDLEDISFRRANKDLEAKKMIKDK